MNSLINIVLIIAVLIIVSIGIFISFGGTANKQNHEVVTDNETVVLNKPVILDKPVKSIDLMNDNSIGVSVDEGTMKLNSSVIESLSAIATETSGARGNVSFKEAKVTLMSISVDGQKVTITEKLFNQLNNLFASIEKTDNLNLPVSITIEIDKKPVVFTKDLIAPLNGKFGKPTSSGYVEPPKSSIVMMPMILTIGDQSIVVTKDVVDKMKETLSAK